MTPRRLVVSLPSAPSNIIRIERTMPQPPQADHFLTEPQSLIQARFPIIHVSTHEEDRCLKAVRQLAKRIPSEEGIMLSCKFGRAAP